jgi:metallophosphoesterase (TIGR03767 family)
MPDAALARTARAHAATAPHPEGTTLDRTILTGRAINAGGYRHLVAGRGEPYLVRDDLGINAGKARASKRVALLALAQFTDMHVLDAQSPARVEFLDRLSDGANGNDVWTAAGASLDLFGASYRPQEMLTAQVADALVRAVRKLGVGPGTSRKLDFAISTGDGVDNCQHNELRWAIDVLDGNKVRPDSGDPSRWEGVDDQNPTYYDVHYWHPAGTPHGVTAGPDLPRSKYGLAMPWMATYGNHDSLLQGNLAPSPLADGYAVGSRKILGLPAGFSLTDLLAALGGDPSLFNQFIKGPSRPVTADHRRRPLTRAQVVAEYFTTSGSPHGHGFTKTNRAHNTAYYTFLSDGVRCIVLDTVNPNGDADGSLDPSQFSWLTSVLDANSETRLRSDGTDEGARGHDRLIMIFSHHTIATMDNGLTGAKAPAERILGDQVRDLLLRYPNVVAWVNGHTHVNNIIPHRRPAAWKTPGGFWEINTASHIDFPQQVRTVELVDNRDGTLSIFGTIIDSDAPLRWTGTSTPTQLASLSRELAANDWQARVPHLDHEGHDGRRGARSDRNVELLVHAPFKVPVPASAG